MENRQRMELLESFRQKRIEIVASAAPPIPLPAGGRFILHLVPSKWIDDPSAVYDVVAIELGSRAFPLFGTKLGAMANRFNFDGQLFYQDIDPGLSYVQFFISGIVEAVEAYHLTRTEKAIEIFDIEDEMIYKLQDYLEIQGKIGVAPPILFMLSIVGASGYGIEHKKFRAGEMLFPPRIIETYEDFKKTPLDILKPIFNRIWNASGYPESLSFAPGGRYSREKST